MEVYPSILNLNMFILVPNSVSDKKRLLYFFCYKMDLDLWDCLGMVKLIL